MTEEVYAFRADALGKLLGKIAAGEILAAAVERALPYLSGTDVETDALNALMKWEETKGKISQTHGLTN